MSKKKLSKEQEYEQMKKKTIALLQAETDYNAIASCAFVLGDRHFSESDGEERAVYLRQMLFSLICNEDIEDIKYMCSLANGFMALKNKKEVAANE